MTSPAITKPKEQKSENKSPTHSEKTPSTDNNGAPTTTIQSETFSFLRIFKLADLMMKQGC